MKMNLGTIAVTCMTALGSLGAFAGDARFCGYEDADGSLAKPFNTIRFASFNASLNRFNTGDLISDLSTTDNAQAQAVAEIVQRVNPDVLLINEFDFDEDGVAADLFRLNYLEVSQNGQAPVHFPHVFLAPSNTGIPSGFDFDNNGSVGGPGDAFGFGFFPGQFAMVLYSKFPINEARARTFQNFVWANMPGALLPDDPETAEPADWYSAEELEVFRLSSKSHWDVPVKICDATVHVLASHPTPPVFDDFPPGVDFNGRRNHDEIRFWSDYVGPAKNARYITDDEGGRGGLRGKAFVIMGDQNADPNDGDSTNNAILQLLNNPAVDAGLIPASFGGFEAAVRQNDANDTHTGSPAFDTGDFGDSNPGNLRADYVLPSKAGLKAECGGVFWPRAADATFPLVGDNFALSSDHRLVWMDLNVKGASCPGAQD